MNNVMLADRYIVYVIDSYKLIKGSPKNPESANTGRNALAANEVLITTQQDGQSLNYASDLGGDDVTRAGISPEDVKKALE